MSKQHTPGPWRVTTIDYRTVCSADGDPEYDAVCIARHKGDARLIAAAPELLAMVERMTDAARNGGRIRKADHMAAAALLARVRGEA